MDQTPVSKDLEPASPRQHVKEAGGCKIHEGWFEKQIQISLLGRGVLLIFGAMIKHDILWLGQLLTRLRKKEVTSSS